jgi:DivIVA domain-containing protein
MTDTPGTPIFPSRDTRLTPEAVADRKFTQVKRGYAESEVRAFLRMVADEVNALLARERDFMTKIHELEERLTRRAELPNDQDLIAALGEETARVLGQAREVARDLRAKADEHARRVVREAQESARDLRQTTQQAVEAKTREAEDAARNRAREIVAEARGLRERVLNDMNERRVDIERQITELRAGRSKLVEAYQVVEQAIAQATKTMMEEPSVSAPSATGATAPVPEGDTGDERAPEAATVAPDAPAAPAAPEIARAEPEPIDARTAEPSSPDAPATENTATVETSRRGNDNVDALFERLRTGSAVDDTPASEAAVVAPSASAEEHSDTAVAVDVTDEPSAAESDTDGTETDDADIARAGGNAPQQSSAEEAQRERDQGAVAARDDALAPIADDLGRRAKRALQDEQNDVLDGLRRQRGKIDATKVLPAREDQVSRWAHVLQPSIDAAYAAWATTVAAPPPGADAGPAAPSALLTELTAAIVVPLRDRLETSLENIDARTPADAEIAIAQRLGARYREWRGQDLEDVLGDALAVAYTRGVYDAAPAGAQLRWIPARLGKCPDCDDNALEPTARGQTFPTGQPYPPAHPGCRCLLVLA